MGELTIGGHKVRALHHGMSGVPGLELFGPWEEREDVRGAIIAPVPTSASDRLALASTRRTRSSPAGSPARSPPYSPETT